MGKLVVVVVLDTERRYDKKWSLNFLRVGLLIIDLGLDPPQSVFSTIAIMTIHLLPSWKLDCPGAVIGRRSHLFPPSFKDLIKWRRRETSDE